MEIGPPLRTIIVEPLESPIEAPPIEPEAKPEIDDPETEPVPVIP